MEPDGYQEWMQILWDTVIESNPEVIACHDPKSETILGSGHHLSLKRINCIRNELVQEVREIGSGLLGTVYQGKWRGQDVAVKRIASTIVSGYSSDAERLRNEFLQGSEILVRLSNINLVEFYGVIQDGPGRTLATVTEYIKDQTLRDVLLTKSKFFGHHQQLRLAVDVAYGMESLHLNNVAHFNLRSANIFVNMADPCRPICKIGDLGLSKVYQHALIHNGVRRNLPWMAPELLNGSRTYDSQKVDVYSFSIVLWEIVTGEVPLVDMDDETFIEGVVHDSLRPPLPSSCEPQLAALIEECWAVDPTKRPSFSNIVDRLHSMIREDLSHINADAWYINMDTLATIKNEDVQEERLLSHNTLCSFYHGKWHEKNVAIRIINAEAWNVNSFEAELRRHEFVQEAKTIAELNHKNVVTFCGVIQDGPEGTPAIVTEYLDGSLSDILRLNKWQFDQHQRLLVASDVAAGMKYLHRKKLVHCDLSSHNIIADMKDSSRLVCKVGGLHLLKKKRDLSRSGGKWGDLQWMAPELLEESSGYEISEKIDVYSFGIVLWEILTGEEANMSASAYMPYAAIRFAEGIADKKPKPPVSRSLDPEWRSLMEECSATDPSARPSFAQIVKRLKPMCRTARIYSHPMFNYDPEEDEMEDEDK